MVKNKKVVKKAKKPIKAAKKIIKKEILIGKVIHFFDKIKVAVIAVEKPIKIGDKIQIAGNTTNFEQKVESMQIEYNPVKKAGKGDDIGMKVKETVREGDKVYLL
jgi:putative protease